MKKYIQFINEMNVETAQFRLQGYCRDGRLDMVEDCVYYGADIHKNNEEALFNACRYGHYDIFRYLVKMGADIHVIYNDHSSLQSAVWGGNFRIVKFLIKKGIEYEIRKNGNSDILSSACMNGHMDIIKYLVEEKGFDPSQNYTYLYRALEHKKLEPVKYLVEHGADVNAHEDIATSTLQSDRVDIIRYMLDHGLNVLIPKLFDKQQMHEWSRRAIYIVWKHVIDNHPDFFNKIVKELPDSPELMMEYPWLYAGADQGLLGLKQNKAI